MMIRDFLKHHNIPYPPHLDGWDELEYTRILRCKGPITAKNLPKVLHFKGLMEKAGLPLKNVIFDGKKVTEVDSPAIAALLVRLKGEKRRIGIINPPPEFKIFLEKFADRDKLQIFASEEEAIAEFNQPSNETEYIPSVFKSLKVHKCLTLLIALIVFLIALPFFEADMTAIFYLMFFASVLLAGIYAVSYNMRHVAGGVFLATPTLITAWSNMFMKDQRILNAEMIFLTIFLIYTLMVILLHVLSIKKVTVNELFGAMCVYIMIGMTFGVIYALLESLVPGSLSFPPGEVAPKMTAYYYFSFVSMSLTGFSGFTAVSSLARAIVIVQVIIGVMYVSALIGKLVGANTPEDDGIFEGMERRLRVDYWSQELTENFFRQRITLLVISSAMVNYTGSVIMTLLNWPFFMDSIGTSMAVILGGWRAGVLAGIIYNLIMAWTFWEPSSWVWMFCNILIATATWGFLKLGWIDLRKPMRLLLAGIVSGILNSIAVMITTYLTNLPTYQGTMVVYHFFLNLTGDPAFASLSEKGAVEIVDKTISLLLVMVGVIYIRDFLNWNKNVSNERMAKAK